VALIHADDRHHVSCREALRKIREPLGTVWPAITEAMYLLGFSPKRRTLSGAFSKAMPSRSCLSTQRTCRECGN